MHLQPLERAIILLCRRIGERGVIALITATSITLSVVATLVLVVPQFSLEYSTDLILLVSVAIAVAIPLVVAPITVGLVISLLVRLDDAYLTLLKLSTTDSLTGATNRRGFFADVTARVQSLDHTDSIFVGMVDLNSFKNLNDSFGHQFGDEVLCAVVSRLRLVLGEDVVVMCHTCWKT
jgi:predicted signal transduction protein with EAL and GGDEF domain